MLDHILPLPHRLSSVPLVVSLVNHGQKAKFKLTVQL